MSFYKWGNWGTEQLSNFSHVIQLIKRKTRIESRAVWPQGLLRCIICYFYRNTKSQHLLTYLPRCWCLRPKWVKMDFYLFSFSQHLEILTCIGCLLFACCMNEGQSRRYGCGWKEGMRLAPGLPSLSWPGGRFQGQGPGARLRTNRQVPVLTWLPLNLPLPLASAPDGFFQNSRIGSTFLAQVTKTRVTPDTQVPCVSD